MVHASLFSGIGGFDLAAHWMGWTNLFQVERDPFCLAVLEHHFPEAKRFGDIHEFTGPTTVQYANRVDVLSGGFPCQPYSTAGKRRGKGDDRHLWPQMHRVIREVRPRWVVGENVRGLTDWEGGVVLDEVLASLEEEGYRCAPPFIIPACGKDAPHRRDRVWLIAYADGTGNARSDGGEHREEAEEVRREEAGNVPDQRSRPGLAANAQGGGYGPRSDADAQGGQRGTRPGDGAQRGPAANADDEQPYQREGENGSHHQRTAAGRAELRPGGSIARTGWEGFPTVPPVRVGNDGLPSFLVRHTTGESSGHDARKVEARRREEALKGAGNAIVPHIALAIFNAIEYVEAQRRIATGTT